MDIPFSSSIPSEKYLALLKSVWYNIPIDDVNPVDSAAQTTQTDWSLMPAVQSYVFLPTGEDYNHPVGGGSNLMTYENSGPFSC